MGLFSSEGVRDEAIHGERERIRLNQRELKRARQRGDANSAEAAESNIRQSRATLRKWGA